MLLCIVFGCKENGSDTITIGTVLSLTGEGKVWGNNTLKGANLAIEEINSKGGVLGKKLEIDDAGDSKSTPVGAVSAIQKMVTNNEIECIIGDVMSSNTLSIAPIAEKNKKVLLNFCVAVELSQAGDYIFRNWNSAVSDATATFEIAKQKSNRIAILYQNDSYGNSLKNEFAKLIENSGKEIVLVEAFDRNSLDFKSLITKMKSDEYDGIFMASYFSEALSFIKQYLQLNGANVPIYGTSEWQSKNLIEFIKEEYPNMVYYGYPIPPDSSNPVRRNFEEAYQKKYGESPDILSDNGYDAIYQLVYGINKAGSYNATKIKEALYTLKDFEGASGTMSFDSNGDVHKPFGIKIIGSTGDEWYEGTN